MTSQNGTEQHWFEAKKMQQFDQILLSRQKQMLFYSKVNETQRIISCYKTLQ
jgi:hypothetical protein